MSLSMNELAQARELVGRVLDDCALTPISSRWSLAKGSGRSDSNVPWRVAGKPAC